MPSDNILSGLRVLDCATYIAAPCAATIMADYGADVVKIERPLTGDPYRSIVHNPGFPVSEWNYTWIMDSRNKRSIALNLANPIGRDALLRLASRADVFITNFQPQLLAKFQIRHADLAPLNPRLIYASVTGYGNAGPEADSPGYDVTAYFARSGLMSYIHNEGCEPATSPCGYGDHPTSVSLFAAIMMALYRRLQTGQGAHVHTNLMHNGVWSNGSFVQAALCGAQFAPRQTRSAAHNPLLNHYVAADGRRFFFCLLDPAKDWPKLCRACGHPEWTADPRFATTEARRQNRELIALLDAVFATAPLDAWKLRFAEHDVLYGIVPNTWELPGDPQMHAAGVFPEISDAPVPMRTVTSPLHIEGQPKEPARWAPGPGQHTSEILREAGYTEAEIRAMLETEAAWTSTEN
jgi:crotonobetainyl-CoA:carnitine CoA-transferase CaiB-like acyl-CoA transferase